MRFNRYSTYPDNLDDLPVEYVYDNAETGKNGKGQLHKVIKSDGTRFAAETKYDAYDSVGRSLGVTRTIVGQSAATTRYTYDIAGRAYEIIYPDGYKVEHTYWDHTNLLHEVTAQNGAIRHAELSDYKPTGKIGNILDGGNAETTYTYDGYSTRLTSILTELTDGTEEILQNKTYIYTKAGDIHSIEDNLVGSLNTYGYDALHRLKSETPSGSEV